jgi:hypothetical protein
MYLVFILCLVILPYLVSLAGFSEVPINLPIAGDQLLLVASVTNLVLTVLAFVDKPGGIVFSGIG